MYATAWYRLTLIADWDNSFNDFVRASSKTLQYAGRLKDRDRQVVEALVPLVDGDHDIAELKLRALVEEDSNNVLLNYQLALLLYGYGWRTGRRIGLSIEPFRKVLERIIDDTNLDDPCSCRVADCELLICRT